MLRKTKKEDGATILREICKHISDNSRNNDLGKKMGYILDSIRSPLVTSSVVTFMVSCVLTSAFRAT